MGRRGSFFRRPGGEPVADSEEDEYRAMSSPTARALMHNLAAVALHDVSPDSLVFGVPGRTARLVEPGIAIGESTA